MGKVILGLALVGSIAYVIYRMQKGHYHGDKRNMLFDSPIDRDKRLL